MAGPYSLLDTSLKTAFFDPSTGQSTNPDVQQAMAQIRALKTPDQIEQASDQYRQAFQGLKGIAGYTPEQVAAAQAAGPQDWTTEQARKYMSPYTETALRSQLDIQNQDFLKQLQGIKGQAQQAGAYGGARQAVAEQNAQFYQNLANQNLVAQGMNQAYNTGLSAFQNQNQLAQQTALANMAAQNQIAQGNQQAGLAAHGQNIGAYGTMGQLSGGLGQMGDLQNQIQLRNISALMQSGMAQQNLAQNYLNNRSQSAANWFNMPMTYTGAGIAAAPQGMGSMGTYTQMGTPASAW